MSPNKVIEVDSKRNFEYAKQYLIDITDSDLYSATWAAINQKKREFYELLPVFWQTPLARGLKELEECDCDRFFRWVAPFFNDWPTIITSGPVGSTIRFNVPLDYFLPRNDYLSVLSLYKQLQISTDIDFDQLPPPSPVGCITYESADGYFFNANTLKYLYQHWRIHNLARDIFLKNHLTMIEIGGGYGGLAYQMIHSHNNVDIVIVDLPETIIIAIYFLRENFPQIPIGLYTDLNSKINSESYRVHFIPSFYANKICDCEFDIVVNSESLLEMRPEDIELYFSLIQERNRVRYFYNFNRKSRIEGGKKYKFDEFPYDEKWKHILDQESLFDSWKDKLGPIIERMSVRSG
jgi:hypothetical protein